MLFSSFSNRVKENSLIENFEKQSIFLLHGHVFVRSDETVNPLVVEGGAFGAPPPVFSVNNFFGADLGNAFRYS
jgi:hypothetical protein